MPTHYGTATKDGKKVKVTIRDKRPKKIEKPEKPKRKVIITDKRQKKVEKPVKKPMKIIINMKEGPKRKEDTLERTHIDGKKLTKKELKELGVWRYMTDDQISHFIRVNRQHREAEDKKRRERLGRNRKN